MKVKKKQLSGKIADFPLHVVQRMVDEQVKQGNPADPSVFAYMPRATKAADGFDWDKTDEGDKFWSNVIRFKCFHLIPKPEKPKGHAHAKAMRQYAKDAKNSEKPWENWEFQVAGDAKWYSFGTHPNWWVTSQYRRKSNNQVEPETNSKVQPTPNEIVRAMLAKGMTVWAVVSDVSYDDARKRMSKNVYYVDKYDDGSNFPVRAGGARWVYAVPIDTATMTEITELP